MARVGNFHHHGLDHRHIQTGRHPVVEEAGVQHRPVAVVAVLLVQRPADALHRAALDLPLDIAGMHRGADIHKGGAADNVHLAGFGVHFDVDDVAGDDRPYARGYGGHRGGDGAAGAHHPAGQFLESELVFGIAGAGENPVGERHILFLHFPDRGGAGGHLPLDILGGLDRGEAGVKGGAAAPGDRRVADGVGVYHRRNHILGGDAQNLGGLHRHRGAGAANVHRPGDQPDGAVAVDDDGSGGHLARLPAVAYRYAAAPLGRRVGRLAQRLAIMGMGLHCLFHFADAEAGMRHAVGHPVALFGYVL